MHTGSSVALNPKCERPEMLTIKPAQFATLATESGERFVDRVCDFLESDYPEVAGTDAEAGRQMARKLIDRALQFGLLSQEGVLRFIGMLLGYFMHEPQGYAWAHVLLSDPGLPEQEKLLALEHRLYGVPLWA